MNILCCDWGTSSFRLRLVDDVSFQVIAELQSADGVAGTFRNWKEQESAGRFEFYSEKLKQLIHELSEKEGLDLSRTPVLVSGMASSSIGMEEIPYAPLPFAVDGAGLSAKVYDQFNGQGAPLVLVSGVRSDNDVMRGEEAQLIGLFHLPELSLDNSQGALFVFPGTHSKHIHVRDHQMIGFKTYMTGEIFNTISEYTILKDSIDRQNHPELTGQGNSEAFKLGVESSGNLLNSLFTVRTNQLFSKLSKEQNLFYLSGLLIGSELKDLTGKNTATLVICSGSSLYGHYRLAVQALGLENKSTFISPDLIDKATIAGQIQLFKAINRYSNG